MLIVISGLIGAGKTTLCKSLKGKHFFEPVENNPFLQSYYKEPEKYAFKMQMYLLLKRFEAMQAADWANLAGEDVIVDRSIYEDFQFALVQQQSGYMTDKEFEIYEEYHTLMQRFLVFPDLILHLDVTMDNLMERINARARNCEAGIPREYMESLQKAYDFIIPKLEKKCNLVKINANRGPEYVLEEAKRVIETYRPICAEYPRFKGGC
jgi:deoxyadenosine/deoxycytidine kinase